MFGSQWDRGQATIIDVKRKYSGDGSVSTDQFVADIRTAEGETFRSIVRPPSIATNFWPPSIGQTVGVLIRASDRKVKFDKDDEQLNARQVMKRQQRTFDDAAAAPAGTTTTPWSPPAGWRVSMPSPDQAADPAARLTKLSRLRDGGLLTDAEFAAQRQRILDEI